MEKGVVLRLNQIESPLPKDALCQVWSKLAQCFWRRRFFNFVNVFLLFRYYLPIGKGQDPSFEQTWIYFTQGCFVPSLVEIWKMWKVYGQTDGRFSIRKPHLSFQLRWAKNCNFANSIQFLSKILSGYTAVLFIRTVPGGFVRMYMYKNYKHITLMKFIISFWNKKTFIIFWVFFY